MFIKKNFEVLFWVNMPRVAETVSEERRTDESAFNILCQEKVTMKLWAEYFFYAE